MTDDSEKRWQFLSYEDDQPNEQMGALIPHKKPEIVPVPDNANFHPFGATPVASSVPFVGFGFAAIALFLLALTATTGYGLLNQSHLAALPAVTVIDPEGNQATQIVYGPEPLLKNPNVFSETRDAFIDAEVSFIEIDAAAQVLRFFKDGVLRIQTPIVSMGNKDAWFTAPAGLYQVTETARSNYSNVAQFYLADAIRFGGNYMIHGDVSYPDGHTVPVGEAGIQLPATAAAELRVMVTDDISVMVSSVSDPVASFTYEAEVVGVAAEQYGVVDLETNAVLAAKQYNDVVPVASITKLMTALVAVEMIDMDSTVLVEPASLIETVIPRLSGRKTVGMYDLLQLLLVESSNEAAELMAAEIGRDGFVAAMNEKAAQLGMRDTVFVDPSGLGADNVSSVADLVVLTQFITKEQPFILRVTNEGEYVSDTFTGLINFNQIGNTAGFVGGKVGETSAAGQTSVSVHELSLNGSTRQLGFYVLGSSDRARDLAVLMAHVENTYSD